MARRSCTMNPRSMGVCDDWDEDEPVQVERAERPLLTEPVDDEEENTPTFGTTKEIEKYIKKWDQEEVCRPIQVNIYQMRGLGWDGTNFRRNMGMDALWKVCGLYMIPIIQVIGPAAIMVWAYYHLDFSNVEVRSPFAYKAGSEKHGISCMTTRLMATLFLYLFALYGVATITGNEGTLLKLRLMFRIMQQHDNKSMSVIMQGHPKEAEGLCSTKSGHQQEEYSYMMNVVGPLINSWVVLLSSFDMVLLFIMSETPKDVLFDSLGLFFLFNLDDVPGQVDAFCPEWPKEAVGKVYWRILYQDFVNDGFTYIEKPGMNTQSGFADPNFVLENMGQIGPRYNISRNWIYVLTRRALLFLVVLLPIAYLFLCDSVTVITEAS